MFKFLRIYCYAIEIFITKLVFKYAFEYYSNIDKNSHSSIENPPNSIHESSSK